MNVQQLFEAIGNIDDRFIDEAASDAIPHVKRKIAAVAAAAAAVITGTVLYSTAMLNRPAPTPEDLSAPIVTAAPDVPTETAQPAPDPSNPVSITPEQGGDQTTTPVQPTPNQPYNPGVSGGWSAGLPSLPGSGGSGSGALPGIPLPGMGGAGLPGSGSAGSSPPGSDPLPGSGTALPEHPIAYFGRYSHSAAGDFIVFYEPYHGIPVLTKNITGQIVDGHYAATVYGFPFGQSRYVELQVYADGSYDLTVN
ncbi:MAG: hypothetical protein IJI27_01030 [Oscillospiraceae bacterium]|nr:hypothetical protein [Oscillospiraceae bacterium]